VGINVGRKDMKEGRKEERKEVVEVGRKEGV
jgi:hypothetical protein